MKKSISKVIYLIFTCLLILSCTSKINQDNFEKIKIGMSLDEAIQILGPPASSATMSLGGTTGTSMQWKNRNGMISIQFFNARVKVKKYVKGVTTSREQ